MRCEHIKDDVVVYLGDCLEIVPTLVGVDAVVSDPPYGMKWDTDASRFSGGNHVRSPAVRIWSEILEDDRAFDPAPWLSFPDVVLWGANHYASRLPVGTTLVWLKKEARHFGTFLSDAEIGWSKGGHGVYAHFKQFAPPSRAFEAGGVAAHPTQKPISLMRWCIETFTPKACRILDPYMGSGTTGVAAIELGRGFVGIEKQPAYFDAACRRLATAAVADKAGQASLFAGVPREKSKQEALTV